MRLGRSGRRRIACGEVFVDVLADRPELTLLELADADAAPAFGGADQRGIHQLQDGAFAEGMRDDFGAPPLLAKQALQQIGGADRSAMAEREAQMRDAGLEIVLEAGQCARQVAAIGRPDVIAQQPRQGRRGGLIAGGGAGLELGPEVFRQFACQIAHLVRQAALPQSAWEYSSIARMIPGAPSLTTNSG